MSVDHYDYKCCSHTGIYEEYITWCEYCRIRLCSDCTLKTSQDYPYMGEDIKNKDGLLKK